MNQVNSILAWATLVHVVFKCDEWADTTKYNVNYEHHRVTSNCHCDNLLGAWNAQHSTGMIHNSKMRINHESMQYKHQIVTINKTHSNKLNKMTQPIFETQVFQKLNINSKINKSRAINMKYIEKDEKPIPFLEVWRRDDEEKWWICEWNTVSMWERRMKKTMNSKKCLRENWKV